MATIGPAGSGLAAGPHPTVPNLWVREVDQTRTTVYPPPVISGVIKGQPTADVNIYSHGCLLTQVDGTTSLSAQWENTGTLASPSWQRWQI